MINRIFNSSFFRSVFLMYLATGILSGGTLFYHILMGRSLTQKQFGELESAISLFYILSIPLMTISVFIIKYVSYYNGKKDKDSISSLYISLEKITLYFGIGMIVLSLLGSVFIAKFLHFSSFYTVIIMTISQLVGMYVNLQRSFLQGLKNFLGLSFLNLSDTLGKTVFSLIFLFLGFGVNGAVAAFIFGGILTWITGSFLLKEIRGKSNKTVLFKDKLDFLGPVFVINLSMTSLFTTDIVLVRNLYPGEISGQYAALAIMGKIIFYALVPVSSVVFPYASERIARGEKHSHLFVAGLGLTTFGCALVVLGYYLLPDLFLQIFGNKYMNQRNVLWIMGVFLSLYTICNFIINYLLSLHRTSVVYFVSLAAIMQIILIYSFNNDLLSIILSSIFTCSVLFICLLIYYFKISFLENQKIYNRNDK